MGFRPPLDSSSHYIKCKIRHNLTTTWIQQDGYFKISKIFEVILKILSWIFRYNFYGGSRFYEVSAFELYARFVSAIIILEVIRVIIFKSSAQMPCVNGFYFKFFYVYTFIELSLNCFINFQINFLQRLLNYLCF